MRKSVFALLLLVVATAGKALPISADDRATVIRNGADLLEQRYVDPEAGKRMAAKLRQTAPLWSEFRDAKLFAEAMTQWLRRESGDGHLGLSFSEKPISDNEDDESFAAAEMERFYGAHLNHGIEKIERLPGNVMLIDLRVFPPAAMAGDVFAAAMNVTAQADALIIDLRRNGGGAETVNLLTGYLVKPGSPLSGSYDRPSNKHLANVSPSWVPGRRFGTEKPLFILTSKRTFSAAEAVAYDLQALKRAVIVGEVTGGGAHPFAYRRVHPHFALDVPEGKSINPITGGNWQGIGVKPDVEVPADQALDRALILAREAIARGRSGAGSDLRSLP